jgi:hypothetical protein
VGKLVGLVAMIALVASPAFASSSVDDELAEMRELVKGLEQKVDAQQEQIEHQSGMLEDAQKVVRDQQQEQGTLSGMSEFWQAIDVNMSVAGSYAYNFAKPNHEAGSSGAFANGGSSGLFYPFHPDHNSFQVDQVWFDIGKETTAESRAGFHATILYGTTATFLGQGSPAFGRANLDSTSDYYVHQAYVDWLAPIPLEDGVLFRFGKFATPVGAEVADASKNWQVTRGNLYNLLQPIDHLGLWTSTDVGPVTLGAGVVNQNNLATSSPDINSEKSYLAKIGFGTDMFGMATTVLYGAEGLGSFAGTDPNEHRTGLLDLLATFNSDAFSMWANLDYAWVDGSRAAAWGAAVAAMVPITDELSASMRAEYLRDKEANSSFAGDFFGILQPNRHSEIYGLTGTLAYELAENLTLKTEVRWDRVVEFSGPTTPGGATLNEEFLTKENSNGNTDQVVGLAQVVYAF